MGKAGDKSAVILDHHPLWLDALEQLLDRVGVEVVGRTTSSDEAIDLVRERRPDMLVTELELEDDGADGLTSVRRARDVHPELKSVVLAAKDDPANIEAAFEAGATVYCVKSADPEDLAAAMRQAFEHSIYFARSFAMARSNGHAPARPATASADEDAPELTKRELEILQLVAEGYSNSQLAKMLWVTEQTVKFHLSNIYRKLDVANRTEASRWAQLHGLLSSTPAAQTAAA